MSVVFNNKGERIISDVLIRETEGQIKTKEITNPSYDINRLEELSAEKSSVMDVLKKLGANSDFERAKRVLLFNEPISESLRKLETVVPTEFKVHHNAVMSLVENAKTSISDPPPTEQSTILISLEDLKVGTQEISRKKEELSDFDIITTARRQGLSDVAAFVYDTIKTPPTDASNFSIIKDFQYLDRFHYHAFKYGLKELQLMGYIYSFHEDKGSYVLYFTPLGIDSFSNRRLLDTKSSSKPINVKGGCDRTQLDSAVLYLMRECPHFEDALPFLIENGYVEVRDKFLYWKKSKQSLAQYFGSVLLYTRWSDIEKAFRTNGLKGSYHHATTDSPEIIKLKNNNPFK